jgi:hypothetical protein
MAFAIAAVAATVGAGLALTGCGRDLPSLTDAEGVRATLRDAALARAHHDGERVCALYTEAARQNVVAQARGARRTCAVAVTHSLTESNYPGPDHPLFKHELGRIAVARIGVSGERATACVRTRTGYGVGEDDLVRQGGRWLFDVHAPPVVDCTSD